MGTFSWMFADEENRHNLQIGHRGYIALPDGNFLYERGYAGYGIFDGQDVYELVVQWNREYIAASPNAEVPCGSKRHGVFIAKRFRDYWWYPVIADLTLSRDEIVQELQALNPDSYHDLRGVGINIACYDEDNEALPFPIKITRTKSLKYWELPPSKADIAQGSGSIRP